MLKEFLESKENAHKFLEDAVMSSSISSVTDAPPETRIKKPEEDLTNLEL